MTIDIAKFAADIIQRAWLNDVDACDVQEHAVRCGLIHQVEFDPVEHYDGGCGLEKGDIWFVFTPQFKQAISGELVMSPYRPS